MLPAARKRHVVNWGGFDALFTASYTLKFRIIERIEGCHAAAHWAG